MMLRRESLLVALLGLSACEPPPGPPAARFTAAITAPLLARDYAHEMCRARVEEARSRQAVAGSPINDEIRPAMLGRALGEPVVFTEPPAPAEEAPDRPRGLAGVQRLIRRHRQDPEGLRARVLRDGYLYSEDPVEAFALVKELRLEQLFDEDVIWLLRGHTLHRLEKDEGRRGHHYVHAGGPEDGHDAKILAFDRIGTDRDAVADGTRHRDVRALRDEVGFDRMRIEHHSREAMVASLRFDGHWATALIGAKGPELELTCLAEPASRRAEIEAFVEADAPRRRAVASLQRTVGRFATERLPFDRPRHAEDHLSDGQLRPKWEWSYGQGQFGFSFEEEGYAIFDRDGQPHPPQTCIELILDTYERAAGTWYQPQGEKRERVVGALDFDELGIENRSGVLAFGRFTESHPKSFAHRTFDERIPFAQREAFFANLVEKADWFQPGDVVAIQGPKPDGFVHQHGILIEDVDPLTGMPQALFDQMKHPRRRTWEMIMAEAPRRALLYHVQPKPTLLLRLDPEHGRTKVARAETRRQGDPPR